MHDQVIAKTMVMVMAWINFTILILWFFFLTQDNLELLLGWFEEFFKYLKHNLIP